jgi:hypothetical protein
VFVLRGNLTSQGLPGASGRVLPLPVIASYCTKALGLALAVSRRVSASSRRAAPASPASARRLCSASASKASRARGRRRRLPERSATRPSRAHQ